MGSKMVKLLTHARPPGSRGYVHRWLPHSPHRDVQSKQLSGVLFGRQGLPPRHRHHSLRQERL